MEHLYMPNPNDKKVKKEIHFLRKRTAIQGAVIGILFVIIIFLGVTYFFNVPISPYQSGRAIAPKMQTMYENYKEKLEDLEKKLLLYEAKLRHLNITIEEYERKNLDNEMKHSSEHLQINSLVDEMEKKFNSSITELRQEILTNQHRAIQSNKIVFNEIKENFNGVNDSLTGLAGRLEDTNQQITLLQVNTSNLQQQLSDSKEELEMQQLNSTMFIKAKLRHLNITIEEYERKNLDNEMKHSSEHLQINSLVDEMEKKFNSSITELRQEILTNQHRAIQSNKIVFNEIKENFNGVNDSLTGLAGRLENTNQQITLLQVNTSNLQQQLSDSKEELEMQQLNSTMFIKEVEDSMKLSEVSLKNELQVLKNETLTNYSVIMEKLLAIDDATNLSLSTTELKIDEVKRNLSQQIKLFSSNFDQFQENSLLHIASLNSSIKSLQSNLSMIELSIDQIQNNTAEKRRVSELETELNKTLLHLTGSISEIRSNFKDRGQRNEKLIHNVTSALFDLKASLGSLDGSMSSLESNISSTDSRLRLSQVSLELLNASVNSLEGNVSSTDFRLKHFQDKLSQRISETSINFDVFDKWKENTSLAISDIRQAASQLKDKVEKRMTQLQKDMHDQFLQSLPQNYSDYETYDKVDDLQGLGDQRLAHNASEPVAEDIDKHTPDDIYELVPHDSDEPTPDDAGEPVPHDSDEPTPDDAGEPVPHDADELIPDDTGELHDKTSR